MADQPRVEPFEPSVFNPRQTSGRIPVEGAVARGDLPNSDPFVTGKVDGELMTTSPIDLDEHTLRRGQERFNIFCAPCHGQAGYGQGMVVRRGFPQPPSFHIDRLRESPPGHFFDVITNGFGRMSDHASQIPPGERWKIVAYIRALQLSQHAEREQLSPADLKRLEASITESDDAPSNDPDRS